MNFDDLDEFTRYKMKKVDKELLDHVKENPAQYMRRITRVFLLSEQHPKDIERFFWGLVYLGKADFITSEDAVRVGQLFGFVDLK